jgi:hypothetical protein
MILIITLIQHQKFLLFLPILYRLLVDTLTLASVIFKSSVLLILFINT